MTQEPIGLCEFRVALCCAIALISQGLFSSEISKPDAVLTLVAPLYIADAEFRSVLTIENRGDFPVKAFATFESLEGVEAGRAPLPVRAHSSATIDADSVDMTEHRFAGLGSISVLVTSPNVDAIAGQLIIMSRTESTGIHLVETLQSVDEKPHPLQVAVVPTYFSVPVLAVHSLSKFPQHISMSCFGIEARRYESQLLLPAHMTFLVNACIRGRAESRTYEQLLHGDIGPTRRAMTIRIEAAEPEGGISVWGFARTDPLPGSRFQIAGIKFSKTGSLADVLKQQSSVK